MVISNKNNIAGKVINFFKRKEPGIKNNNLLGSFANYYSNKSIFNNLAFNPNTDDSVAGSITEYSTFLKDPHVGACIQSRKAGVFSMNHEVIADDNNSHLKEFVEDCFSALDLNSIISSILNATIYGFVPLEIYYKIKNDKIIISDILEKPADWFVFDKYGVPKFLNRNINGGVIPPAYKMIFAKYQDSYNNPYGVSVLSKCYHAIKFKEGALQLWLEYTEKYGTPYLYASTDLQDQNIINELSQSLESLRRSASIVLPSQIDLTAINANNSSSSENFINLIQYCNAEISKAILSQTLTTEQGNSGSYAMSKTHFDIRKDVVIADSKIAESVFNTIIKWLIDLNFDNIVQYPKFIMYSDLDIDNALAQRDSTLFSGGYCKPTKDYLMKAYGFSDSDLIMIENNNNLPLFAEDEGTNGTNDEVSYNLDIFDELTQRILKEILIQIDKGNSFKDIQNRILDLFPDIDSEDFEDYISKAILISEAQGILSNEV